MKDIEEKKLESFFYSYPLPLHRPAPFRQLARPEGPHEGGGRCVLSCAMMTWRTAFGSSMTPSSGPMRWDLDYFIHLQVLLTEWSIFCWGLFTPSHSAMSLFQDILRISCIFCRTNFPLICYMSEELGSYYAVPTSVCYFLWSAKIVHCPFDPVAICCSVFSLGSWFWF